MAKTTRLFKSFSRLLLPVVILFVLAVIAGSVYLVYKTAQPPTAAYLVTPDKYGQLSARGAQVTDEKWTNRDGTSVRGWLLRGAENAPAIILLHRYGADRSHVLDLGVKINEATNFTILMPDQRGHAQNPTVKQTSFGGCETDDLIAAIDYLRGLKNENQAVLVGQDIGIYGVEMGALAALSVAAANENIKALALDSVPSDANDVLGSAIDKRYPFASSVTSKFAQLGTYFYFYDGCYRRNSMCDVAKAVNNRQVLLLAGMDAPRFQASTVAISNCFPSATKVEVKTDLNPSGFSLTGASLEQSAAYDQRVIEFFKNALGSEN